MTQESEMEDEPQRYETSDEALADLRREIGPRFPLTLSEGLRISEGNVFGTGPVWHYEVLGLPSGEHAFIDNPRVSGGGDRQWQIRRFTDRARF